MTGPRETDTSALIDALVARAGPVRRLRPPGVRAACWLGGAVLVVAVLAGWHGVRPDLTAQLERPTFVLGLLAAAMTGILAAIAAFMLSLPDRGRGWGMLPMPAALLWIGAVGTGCLTDWVRFDPAGFRWGDAASCFGLLLLASVPLSGLLYGMLRHAAAFSPTPVILAGALGVAALSACALSLLHAFEASIMILLWNFGAAAVVMAGNVALGRRLASRRGGVTIP